MGITIEKIEDNEHFEYKGDVHVTGNIGKNSTIVIKDGNLIVDGNIDTGTDINMQQEQKNSVVISSGSIFMSNVSIGGVNTGKNLSVKGKIGDNVRLSSHNASFAIEGSVGDHCNFKTHNGDINTSNVGVNTSLKTHNGDITCVDVGASASLMTHNGSIHANHMGENTSATSHNGNVRVASAPKSAHLDTHNGSVYENGVKRKKEKANNKGATIQIGGMYMSGVVGGRIIVNGKDVTNVVNEAANSNNPEIEQKPVRFQKK